MDIQKFCIDQNDTIRSAMSRIQENRQRCVCVVGENKKFVGIVSQGDILKAFIEGRDQYAKIGVIANPNGVYMRSRDMKKATEIIQAKNFTLLPIVDEQFHLVDVITLGDVFDYLEDRGD